MTTDRDFDRIAMAWLAEGPDELSDRVLDSVTDQIHVTRQRRAMRVPRRFPTMTFSSRVAAAAVIGVLAVGGAFLVFGRPGQPAVGGPTPSPSASPSAAALAVPALTETYASPRNGLTISYPTGWTATPATVAWTRGLILSWGAPTLDTIETNDVRLVMSSQALDPAQTPVAWHQANCELDSPANECAAAIAGGWEKVDIDGATGYRDADGGPPPVAGIAADGQIFGAEVVSSGRGYQFVMDGHVDRGMFDAFLATVKFPAISALDRTYTSALSGYSIKYPSAWAATPATGPWTAGYDTESYSDLVGNGSATLYGASMKLPAGTSFENWFAAYDADRSLNTCGAPSHNEDVTVDTLIGHLDVHCAASYLEAVIPKGGRVYVFTMFQPFNRPLFEALLATVRLTPETATP